MVNKRPLAIVAGISTALVMAVTGCGSIANAVSSPVAPSSSNTAGSTTTGAASTMAVQKGGTAVVSLPNASNITWYLPIENSANAQIQNAELYTQLYPGVLYINSAYQIDYADSFANKVTYNATGTVYTISLKTNWKWSDGKPVTASDVVWDYNLIKATDSPKAPAPWPNYNAGSGGVPDNVKSVVAKNSHTVVITLNKPTNQQWFIYNGIGQLTALPEHAWNKYPKNMTQEITYLGKEATNSNFVNVVDGPFKLTKAVTNQEWDLAPNPYFGGHKTVLNKLVLEYVASSSAEFAALKTGTLDVGTLDQSQLGSKSALTSIGDSILPGYNFGYYYVALNQLKGSVHNSAFNDLKVRQALEMGIDQNTIHSAIDHGYDAQQYGPVPFTPKTIFADPKLKNPVYAFNVAKGKQLLESDGWKMQNGVMTKDGQQLKFTMLYYNGSEADTQMNELIQQDWKQMGVVVDLKPETFSNLIGVVTNTSQPGKWDAYSGTGITYGGSYPSGEQLFEPGGLDDFGYNNATEKALINKTLEPSASQAEWQKNFFAYEEFTAKELPVLYTNTAATIHVESPKVHGLSADYLNTTTGYPLFNYLWMSK